MTSSVTLSPSVSISDASSRILFHVFIEPEGRSKSKVSTDSKINLILVINSICFVWVAPYYNYTGVSCWALDPGDRGTICILSSWRVSISVFCKIFMNPVDIENKTLLSSDWLLSFKAVLKLRPINLSTASRLRGTGRCSCQLKLF